MNHIYNQGKLAACVAYACANGVEDQMGFIIPQEEIEEYYKEHFTDGARLPVFLQKMKLHPMGGVKVKDYEMIYNSRWRTNPKKKLFMSKVRDILWRKSGALVMSMKIRSRSKGDKKIPLDKHGFLVPRKTRAQSYHAMLLSRMTNGGFFAFKRFIAVENSWGREWAKSGCFFMRAKDIHSEAQSIYSVTFEHAESTAN
jgi:hypothetical protein